MLTRKRRPVNVKKLMSTVAFWAINSERMSGSAAIAIWMMTNEEISSEKSLMLRDLKAMEEN